MMATILHSKFIILTTLQVFFVAFLLSYFKVNIPLPKIGILSNLKSRLFANKIRSTRENADFIAKTKPSEEKLIVSIEKSENQPLILTFAELEKFDGSPNAPGLYLALMGKIYDVSKGSKHYGPGGGYHFFAAKDATRAFVTGDFTENGLTDDIAGLSPQDLIGIDDWVHFYEKEYTEIGILQGTYYDANANPTQKLKDSRKALEAARKWQNDQKADLERYPSCNSEWVQGKGGRVWCSNKSGGVTREWVGVPRKLFTPGNGQSRCVCVKNENGDTSAGSDAADSADVTSSDSNANYANELDKPNLRLYDNCDPRAVSCQV